MWLYICHETHICGQVSSRTTQAENEAESQPRHLPYLYDCLGHPNPKSHKYSHRARATHPLGSHDRHRDSNHPFVAACRPIEESVSPQRLGDTRPRYQRNGCNTDLLKRPAGPVVHIVHRRTGSASNCKTRVAPLVWAAER
jgi:hypothetical protein